MTVLGGILCLQFAQAEDVRFNRDIRPILSGHCVSCHGPDEGHREADLRLDTEQGVRRVFAGGITDSEAWARITSTDPDLIMPPADAHSQLSDEHKQRLQAWIASGAAWEGHWSFQTPRFPDVPRPDNEAAQNWIRNPIDAFIWQRLQREDLSPSPLADRETLLRRVTLDLTGLPPAPAEIDAFLSDDSATAWESVVDRLLQSPHFGERMAVSWMDAARYGDTSVFHADGQRDMWPWRDWVIQAYNSNMPFDQFTEQQLAGDLLPNPTVDQQVATGFLRNNATTDEGGLIEEEYRVEYAVDRVKTTSMVWLGLSLECAQCHSHKYDPITQEEYYRFFAFFNQAADPGRQTRRGNQAPVVDLYSDEQLAEAEQLQHRLGPLKSALHDRQTAAAADFEAWRRSSTRAAEPFPVPRCWVPCDETTGSSVPDGAHTQRSGTVHGPAKWEFGHSGMAFDCDGSNFIDLGDAGDFDGSHGFSWGAWLKPQGAGQGTPVSRMDVASAHRGYDLHLSKGAVHVHLAHDWPGNGLHVSSTDKLAPNEWQHVFVTWDGSGQASGIQVYVNGVPWKMTIRKDSLSGTLRSAGPFYIGRRNNEAEFRGLIDDVRVYDQELTPDQVARLAAAGPVDHLLATAEQELSERRQQMLRRHYFTAVDESYRTLLKDSRRLAQKIEDLKKPVVNVMVMNDVPEMRPTFVLDRGNYASPRNDQPVQPGVPSVLPELQTNGPANRLDLARWLTSDTHPLTARVAVNRYWAMLFGEGLVRSVADFGAQGEWPSHPDLLDWLAVDFRESGWDIKHTIRQIVLSATYRQSSRVTAEHQQVDPDNRWLARSPRFRLQAEFVRDNALAAAGLLVATVGGPGVKPYQPAGLWNEVSLNGDLKFVQDHGEKLYRRSLYTYWRRSAPAPSMTLFDAPTREKCQLQRSRTNTPLQALVTLNDVQYVEAARRLAADVLQTPQTDLVDQIRLAFRRCTGSRPSASTLQILQQAYHTELDHYSAHPEAAVLLISAGESARNTSLSPAAHAAMTIVTSMILNLDQTLTRN